MFEKKFYELIKNHYDIVRDKKRFNALLHDYFPREEVWRFNALLFLYDNGIMEELENNPMLDSAEQLRFKNKLKSAYGIKDTYAEWAVKIWVKGFGKWALEQKEWENKIVEYSDWKLEEFDAKKFLECFQNVSLYPRALRKLYLLIPLCKKMKDENDYFNKFIWLLFDKKSNSGYEDYFELFDDFMKLKWKLDCSSDYLLYGVFLLWGVVITDDYLKIDIKRDVEKGFKWIAYFYEQLHTKQYCYLWSEENESSLLTFVDTGIIVALLGMEYAEGNYIEKDTKKSAKCFTRVLNMEPSKWSNMEVGGLLMYNIGSAYMGKEASFTCSLKLSDREYEGFTISYKVRKNVKRAYEFFVKAFECGDVEAIYVLAQLYEHGIGVTKDMKKARELYREAADKNNDGAKEWLKAHDIEIGKEGISSNV